MNEHKIIIPGQPAALTHYNGEDDTNWPDPRLRKLTDAITLSGLWDKDPLKGPIQLSIIFYLPLPVKSPKRLNTPHFYKPSIFSLLGHVSLIARDVLFLESCIITEIDAQKVYAINPRTEITIREE